MKVKKPAARTTQSKSGGNSNNNSMKSGNITEAFNSGNFFLAGDGTPGTAYVYDNAKNSGLTGAVAGASAIAGLVNNGKNQNQFLTDDYLNKYLK